MLLRTTRLAFVFIPLAFAGCAPTGITVPDTTEVPVGPAVVTPSEGLHATLWVQTAAEYRAITLQTYTTARLQLDAALEDPRLSADPIQLAAGGFEDLPPAIILDVDETVLDNSFYQARLIRDGGVYERESWQDWVREEAAPAVPGALEFIEYAAARGVTVIYLTNRRSNVEDATRRNLLAAGFPIADDFDAVLTRGEISEGSDKGPRRAAVAARFRVIQYHGDNLGDFLSDVDTSVEERYRQVLSYADWWGERWFMYPNPQYGSWEGVLFDGDYSLSPDDRLRRKMGGLRYDTAQ